MKTTCPKCKCSYDVPDAKIIGYIENSKRMLAKVAKLVKWKKEKPHV